MDGYKCILFDCMETLVDLTELPSLRDYALWAFDGSGTEKDWGNFDTFYECYNTARKEISQKLPEHKEYEISERFEAAVRIGFPHADGKTLAHIKQSLYDNFWRNYKSRCYVSCEVSGVLRELKGRFILGVVSNFMVDGGIEELLKENGIEDSFDFIVTSIGEGWRKPHPGIYEAAMKKSGVAPAEVLFIGDDYLNDYIAPMEIGMSTILLDRFDRYPEVETRARDFYSIIEILKNRLVF